VGYESVGVGLRIVGVGYESESGDELPEWVTKLSESGYELSEWIMNLSQVTNCRSEL
jgi:hypothetical protein